MATVTAGVSLASTSNLSAYTTGSFTPAEGDLLVVIMGVTATTATPTATASANGITFGAAVVDQAWSAAAHTQAFFVAEQLVPASPSSMTVTVDVTGDAGTGANVHVLRVAGMARVGSDAVLQATANTNVVGTGAAYTLTFGAATDAANTVIVALSNNSNPAGMTAPSGFTEVYDTGYATPSAGLETAYDTSGGFTTATWGSTSATVGTANGIELDTSTPAVFGVASSSLAVTASAAGLPTTHGAASSTLTVTATANGVDRALGQASASLSVTATANGTSATPPVTGVATASLAVTATANGKATTRGAASAALTVTATAAGKPTTRGQATAALSVTATANGVGRAIGAASSSLTVTATAAGKPIVHGAAASTITVTATASGTTATPPVTGQASSSLTVTATAAGKPTTFGVAAASIGVTSTAAGVDRALGAATAALSVTATAIGAARVVGAAASTLTVTATALGVVIPPEVSYTISGDVAPWPYGSSVAHPGGGAPDSPHGGSLLMPAGSSTTFPSGGAP